jgi:RNA 3'-terminal phosphate cyclase (ATP)
MATEIGSQELEFRPGVVRGGRWQFEVGTAGAATLVLQTVLPALLFAREPSHVDIHGGTNVPWSPPQEYIARSFCPRSGAMGAEVAFECLVPGFYPKGGGCIEARVTPLTSARSSRSVDVSEAQLRSLSGVLRGGGATAGAYRAPADRRGARGARLGTGLRSASRRIRTRARPGTMLTIAASFERGHGRLQRHRARGKRAEEVGREAGEEAASFLAAAPRWTATSPTSCCSTRHSRRRTRFVTEEVTEHLRTNAWVISSSLTWRSRSTRPPAS